jgi:hypothetical protein
MERRKRESDPNHNPQKKKNQHNFVFIYYILYTPAASERQHPKN